MISGYATISPDQQTLLVANLFNGIDSYSVSWNGPIITRRQTYAQTFHKAIIVLVSFALQGQWIISGSDNGTVQIFDQRSGGLIKCLRHANCAILSDTLRRLC